MANPNVTVSKILGEAGAGIDASSGGLSKGRLYDVLKELAENPPEKLTAYLGTIATGILAGIVCKKATRLRSLDTNIAVCGYSGTTTVQVLINGVLAHASAVLSTGNAEADGISKSVALDVAVPAGALVQINVSAAGGSATGLTATARLNNFDVES